MSRSTECALRRNAKYFLARNRKDFLSKKHAFAIARSSLGISNVVPSNTENSILCLLLLCSGRNKRADNIMVNVTIKFNYAIKLYLIAKCVAYGTGFCDWID